MRTRRRLPVPATRSAFAGFRFPTDVIVLAVRWYLRLGLSSRDVEELLAKRGVRVDHVSVYRWAQRFTPLPTEAACPDLEQCNSATTAPTVVAGVAVSVAAWHRSPWRKAPGGGVRDG